jgi:hypothetical protein
MSLLFRKHSDGFAERRESWRILPFVAAIGPRAAQAVPRLEALQNGEMRGTSYARMAASLALININPASGKQALVKLERYMAGEEGEFGTAHAGIIIRTLTDIAVARREPAFSSEVVGVLTIALRTPKGSPVLKSDAIHHLGRLGSEASIAAEAVRRAGADSRFQDVARVAMKRIAPSASPARLDKKPTLDVDDDIGLDL